MGLIELLDPRKTAWWNKDGWVQWELYLVEETVEEHEESWDVRPIFVEEWKNKHTGEVRYRRDPYPFGSTCTTFADPTATKTVWELLSIEKELQHIDNLDIEIYDGPDYERR